MMYLPRPPLISLSATRASDLDKPASGSEFRYPRQNGFQAQIVSVTAVVGRRERAKGGSEAAACEGRRRPGLQGRRRSDAAVVGRKERVRAGGGLYSPIK